MNRENKFRCFVPAEGDYYYIEKGNECWIEFREGQWALFIEDVKWESGSGEWVDYPCIREVTDFILEQYTGLKDSYGNEIYEGDIVTYLDREIQPVVYREDLAMFCVQREDGSTTSLSSFYEIVGKIHENPELLK